MAFYIKQNDTSPSILATLADANNVPVPLTGVTVRIHIRDVAGSLLVDRQIEIINPLEGIVRFNWQTGDTATPGTYYAEFEVTYTDDTIETFPNNGKSVIVIKPELN